MKSGASDFNLSEKLDALLKNHSKSLILIDDCITHFVIETISTSIEKTMLSSHYWLFLNRYEYEETFTEIASSELGTKIHFDSQIYFPLTTAKKTAYFVVVVVARKALPYPPLVCGQ